MTWGEWTVIGALTVSIASAAFTFLAPIRAERLRQRSAQRDRELNCFTLLMAERGRWGSPNILASLNAVKVIFRNNQEILDKWFACYSKAGSPQGSVDQYHDLLATIGAHISLRVRREDLENFFVNPVDQRETAVKTAQVSRAFTALSANTSPPA